MASKRYFGLIEIAAIAIFFVVLILSVSIGSVNIAFFDTISAIIRSISRIGDTSYISSSIETIVWNIRLPRVILAALAGGALSVSGAAMQGLLKNPLAESSTLGVSSGGALGAVIFISMGITFPDPILNRFGITIMSILGSFLSLVLILAFSRKIDRTLSGNTIILCGVIFTMFTGSIISFLIAISGDNLKSIIFWSMGSFSGKGVEYLYFMGPVTIAASIMLVRYSRELNAFALGEEQAKYIGVETIKVKYIILILVSILVGSAVSVSGSIAFVGLVIPHITRLLTGPDHKRLLPLSIIFGSSFLMLTDLVSRTLLKPAEIPIGVITSFIGSIIFIYIFYNSSRKAGS